MELQKINSGLHYGYCQVGKFITLYPQSAEEAVSLARRLRYLTRDYSAPAVPFDLRFGREGCVYYRYGSFKPQAIKNDDGTSTPALRDRAGKLIPDVRYSPGSMPGWITNPFVDRGSQAEPPSVDSPLTDTFRVFRSLAQRGKGGVYQAVDFSANPPRQCILKEGRDCGEVTWDGRDGYWLVKHEQEVLTSLRRSGVCVPAVISAFEANNNYYLVTEFIQGENLQDLLYKEKRRLNLSRALDYAAQLSEIIRSIHKAGWAWRDCKPANIIVTKDGLLRPLDFEGACLIREPSYMPWSTPSFIPPTQTGTAPVSPRATDLYSLGVVIYFLLSGRLPDAQNPTALGKLRTGVPRSACDLVSQLLDVGRLAHFNYESVFKRLRDLASRETAVVKAGYSAAKGL